MKKKSTTKNVIKFVVCAIVCIGLGVGSYFLTSHIKDKVTDTNQPEISTEVDVNSTTDEVLA